MSTWKNCSSVSLPTCISCNKYTYFISHCRACGDFVCTSCITTIDTKPTVIEYCDNIPKDKEKYHKFCKACLQSIKYRKAVKNWGKILLRWMILFDIKHDTWAELLKIVPSKACRTACTLLLESYQRATEPDKIEFANRAERTQNLESCELQSKLIANEDKVTYFDVVYRTEKYKHLGLSTLSTPAYMMLTACLNQPDRFITKQINKKHKYLNTLGFRMLNTQFRKAILERLSVRQSLEMLQHHAENLTANEQQSIVLKIDTDGYKRYQKYLENLMTFSTLINTSSKETALDEDVCLSLKNCDILYKSLFHRLSGFHIEDHKIQHVRISTDTCLTLSLFMNVNVNILYSLCLLAPKTYQHVFTNIVNTKSTNLLVENVLSKSELFDLNRASKKSKSAVEIILTIYQYCTQKYIDIEKSVFIVDSSCVLVPLSIEFTDTSPEEEKQDSNIELLFYTSTELIYWISKFLEHPQHICTVTRPPNKYIFKF